MNREQLTQLARDMGLDEVADELAQLAMWGARLRPTDARAEIGGSRLGGLPDLPPGTEWPSVRPPHPRAGEPMMFIAQVNLAQVPHTPPGLSDDLLSFFCAGVRESSAEPVFFDHPGAGHVQRLDRNSVLEPLEPPAQLPEASVLGPTPLAATPELTIPLDAHTLRQLGFDPDELEVDDTPLGRYYALRERLLEHQGLQLRRRAVPPDHRLLGHPTTIEYDVLADAAARGLERRFGEPPELDESDAEASVWRLLLQVESDLETSAPDDDSLPAESGVLFGDGGILYFCLPGDDLEAGRLDAVEAVIQSA